MTYFCQPSKESKKYSSESEEESSEEESEDVPAKNSKKVMMSFFCGLLHILL